MSMETQCKRYDVFLSHASEDKDDVARPLATALVGFKLEIWYDEFALRVGDSLTAEIDNGLARSDYGVVILSKYFFKKYRTNEERNGLVNKAVVSGRKIILPVWHNVTKDDVYEYSPTLVDRYALNTTMGMDVVAQKLVEEIKGSDYVKNILSESLRTKLKDDVKSLNDDLITLLKQGSVAIFNKKRHEHPKISVDLHDLELLNGNLDGADLSEANFRGANLQGTSFRYANFYGATLMETNLTGTNFYHAALKHANLQYAKLKLSSLEYAYLDRADLQHADLTNASLKYASFECADLRDTIFIAANLYGTSRLPLTVQEAIARGAIFQQV
jgi:hypothetical protein